MLTRVYSLFLLLGWWHLISIAYAAPRELLRDHLKTDNVVMIVIDTLRADHLPCYGYERDTAPFLCSLAKNGLLFERALAPSSATAPSMASVFTALFPSEHGVYTGKMGFKRLLKKDPTMTINKIPGVLKILPEYFHEAGYRTFGVVDNFQMSSELGFTDGFDSFQGFKNEGADVVNRQLFSWKDTLKKGGKYFLYIHYMDPHYPYLAREPWYQEGKTRQEKIINSYDSEISFVDSAVKDLFNAFTWKENALVIVLSDHGEEFWEHGKLGHGKNVYLSTTHVPLMLLHREIEAARIESWVSTIDILPTLADLLGFEKNPHWYGHDLLDAAVKPSPKAVANFSELLRLPQDDRPDARSVIMHRHHLIRTIEKNKQASEELYNVAEDISETKDILKSPPLAISEVRTALDQQIAESQLVSPEQTTIEIDEETLKSLQTLGYIQ